MWPTRCMNGSIRESHRQHQQRYACNRCMLILVCFGADLEQSVLIRERANECVDRVRADLTAPTFSSADSGEQNVEHAPVTTTTYQRRPIPVPPMKRLLLFSLYSPVHDTRGYSAGHLLAHDSWEAAECECCSVPARTRLGRIRRQA